MNIFLPDRLPQEFFLLNYLILTEPRIKRVVLVDKEARHRAI